MNPVRLLVLLAISLPLLLGGCGEKAKVEPVAEVKPKLDGVDRNKLEIRETSYYLKYSDTPYTGKAYALHRNGKKFKKSNFKDGWFEGLQLSWYSNGQKMGEENFKDGKQDGLSVSWHKNGQKMLEGNWKDGQKDGLYVSWHKKRAEEKRRKLEGRQTCRFSKVLEQQRRAC